MATLAPAVRQVAEFVYDRNQCTTDDIAENTDRPIALIEDCVDRLEGEYIEINDDTITITQKGERLFN